MMRKALSFTIIEEVDKSTVSYIPSWNFDIAKRHNRPGRSNYKMMHQRKTYSSPQ